MKGARVGKASPLLVYGGVAAVLCLLLLLFQFWQLDGTAAVVPSADAETLQHLSRLEEEIKALEEQQKQLAHALREAQSLYQSGNVAEQPGSEVTNPSVPSKPSTPSTTTKQENGATHHRPPTPPEKPKAAGDEFVLAVGGTDGSGTRSIVVMLQQLGVRMVVDDKGTQDVHAASMGGWPPVVASVIAETHTLNYEVDRLSEKLVSNTEKSLAKLYKDLTTKSKRAKGTAPKAAYGFKAPVSMALTPFFHKTLPRVKFLHVVRDGRDIAFSGNQTPLKKYFDAYYQGKDDQYEQLSKASTQLKAIRMWSDWNVEMFEWETKHRSDTFDYFILRTEDLLDPATKFNTIRAVAEFVGSDVSEEQICCMAVAPASFMGSHSRGVTAHTAGSAANTVKSRYGKWHSHVQGQPELEAALNQYGAKGLEMFGYEPQRDISPPAHPEARCVMTVEQCEAKFGKQFMPPSKPGSKAPVKISARDPSQFSCTFRPNVDYKGGSSDLYSTGVSTVEECCEKCKSTQRCSHFTFDGSQDRCFLKTSTGKVMTDPSLVSGDLTTVGSSS